jgi:hypothetical protein
MKEAIHLHLDACTDRTLVEFCLSQRQSVRLFTPFNLHEIRQYCVDQLVHVFIF